jgi:DNA-binding NtrC family response regulator
MGMLEILLADDDSTIRLTVGEALRDRGHRVQHAKDGAEAKALLEKERFDLAISDIRMPKVDGMELFRFIRERSPATDVILMTGYGEVEQAVAALKSGAVDYLSKPVDLDEIVHRVERIEERRTMEHELESARAELRGLAKGRIIGKSTAIAKLLDMIETIAESDAPVLIAGETGTGKELVARRIHELSLRRDKPFVAVNCAAFPETLLEAELFGHEAGAFTGAAKKRDGRFVAAQGGTLLLDEVGEIPPMAQAKLLRVLQEGTIEPLGTNEPIKVDVRVLSATHRDLKERIKEGLFREDLYYRLNVLDVSIPPLRDRAGDLPILVEYFLERFSRGKTPPALSPQAWAALSNHPFYGNVRELEHAIQRAVVLARGTIEVDHLPEEIAGRRQQVAPQQDTGGIRPLAIVVREFEREYIERALAAAEGKKARAADMLGISRKNLWEKCKALGIED